MNAWWLKVLPWMMRHVLSLGYCNGEDLLVYICVHFLHKVLSCLCVPCAALLLDHPQYRLSSDEMLTHGHDIKKISIMGLELGNAGWLGHSKEGRMSSAYTRWMFGCTRGKALQSRTLSPIALLILKRL